MRLTIQNATNDSVFDIEIDDDGTIEDIKIFIEVESGILLASQVLFHAGKVLSNDQ